MAIDSKKRLDDIGFHMFLVLSAYRMSEKEYQDELADDRDLIRQELMSEDEFKWKNGLQRLARELRRRDDMPSREDAWLWALMWGDIFEATKQTGD